MPTLTVRQFDALRCRLHWAVRSELDPALVNRRIVECRLTCWCVMSGSMHLEVSTWRAPLPLRRWFLLPILPRTQRAAPGTMLASLHFEASWCDGSPLLQPTQPRDLGPADGTFGRAASALIAACTEAAPGAGRAWRSGGVDVASGLTVDARLRTCLAILVQIAQDALRLPSDDDVVRRAMALIAASHVTPGSLAAALGLSRSQLDRRFRASLGRSPREVIAAARLVTAQEALAAGRPLAAVARSAGFAHATHFSAWFRRATGMPPSAWACGLHA